VRARRLEAASLLPLGLLPLPVLPLGIGTVTFECPNGRERVPSETESVAAGESSHSHNGS
jgi:hypothetical protein